MYAKTGASPTAAFAGLALPVVMVFGNVGAGPDVASALCLEIGGSFVPGWFPVMRTPSASHGQRSSAPTGGGNGR